MAMDLRESASEGPRRSYYTAEFVVALKHLDRVKKTLEDSHVRYDDVKCSPDLGLALVKLSNDKTAATRINEALEDEQRKRNRAATVPDPRTAHTDLDRFIWGLRELFATRSAGWSPTVGKNRLVGDVIDGVGKVSHGGGDMPTALKRGFGARSKLSEDLASKGKGVRVAVLDTSISSHEWLAGGWVSPPDGVLAARKQQAVTAGHATFVAGLVLDQAPACVVEARRLLSDEFGQATSWEAATAIAEIGKTRPDILNLSFVCYTEDGQAPLALATAIDQLDSETVVVAAAGNHGDLKLEREGEVENWDEDDRRKPAWPAALDGVVAIGAAHRNGKQAKFTPADVMWIDALAQGVKVRSTFVTASVDVTEDGDRSPVVKPFAGWASWSGTSFAAASVSGKIAAATVPGEVSARQAWESILDNAQKGSSQPPLIP